MFETFERVSTFLNIVKILNHIFRKRSKPNVLIILIYFNNVFFIPIVIRIVDTDIHIYNLDL